MSHEPVNPFFEVEQVDDLDAWRPLSRLAEHLPERVRAAKTYLDALTGSDVDTRVAASVMSLGLYARLLSPTVGALAAGSTVADPLLWQPAGGAGLLRLGTTGGTAEPDLPTLLTGVLGDLVREFATRFSVSATIGWGNVASALFGAARMCGADVSAALDAPPLAGTGSIGTGSIGTGSIGTGGFVRASCCLYYRVGGGYCGDCILARG